MNITTFIGAVVGIFLGALAVGYMFRDLFDIFIAR